MFTIDKKRIPPHLLKYFVLKGKKTIIRRGYISHLIQIFGEVKRVLKDTGTCWVVIGDTYNSHVATSKNVGGFEGEQMRNNPLYSASKITNKKEGIPDKSLCCIPDRFKIAMVDSGWICRNDIIWFKKNCMPSSASDRFTVDYERVLFFSKQGRYYFEQQFEDNQTIGDWKEAEIKSSGNGETSLTSGYNRMGSISQGRNKRCVWQVNTKPYKEAHFATFSPELVTVPILAGCPEYICNKCGKAREKIIEWVGETTGDKLSERGYSVKRGQDSSRQALDYAGGHGNNTREIKGITYTTCPCGAGFHSGIVLDPFMGSGTTALVALQLNRQFIGIELNQNYISMARKRIQPELEKQSLFQEAKGEI